MIIPHDPYVCVWRWECKSCVCVWRWECKSCVIVCACGGGSVRVV